MRPCIVCTTGSTSSPGYSEYHASQTFRGWRKTADPAEKVWRANALPFAQVVEYLYSEYL